MQAGLTYRLIHSALDSAMSVPRTKCLLYGGTPEAAADQLMRTIEVLSRTDIFEKFQAKDRIHFCLMMNAPLNSPLLENYNVA